MKFGQRIIGLLVLLAWLPASSHCLIAAALQNVAVSDCCIESKLKQGADNHHDFDCCPFCDTFQSGKFLTSTKDKLDVGASMVEMMPLVVAVQTAPESHSASPFILHESPSEAARWQFVTRSARMGRSPNVSV